MGFEQPPGKLGIALADTGAMLHTKSCMSTSKAISHACAVLAASNHSKPLKLLTGSNATLLELDVLARQLWLNFRFVW